MASATSVGIRSAVCAAAAAAALAAAPASADWVQPSQRVDAREGSVVNGDVGAWGRAVAFFTQPPAGQPPAAAQLYATESTPGVPAWTQPPTPVALPAGVAVGSGYQVEVARNGNARGGFISAGNAYLLAWDAGGAPSVAATPILTGLVGGSLRVALAPDGSAHFVALTTGAAPQVKYVRVAPDGTAGAEEVLGAGAEADVAASAGGVAVAYTRTLPSAEKRIVVRRRLGAQDAFSSEGPGQVDSANPSDDQPALGIAPNGDIAVAYRSTPAKTFGGQFQPPTKVRFALWAADAIAVGDPRDLSDPPPPPTPPELGPNNASPRVAVDDSGRVTFAWEARPSGNSTIVAAELVAGTLSARQALGNGTRLALGVSPQGHAVLVFHDPPDQTPHVIGMERPTGNLFANRRTISITGGSAGTAVFNFVPRLAVSPGQADAFFLQSFGSGSSGTVGAVTARNVLPSIAPPDQQPVTDARGCPPGNPTQNGTAGDDALAGTPGNDNLIGDAGNDRVAGLAGDDCVRGEDGNDDLGGDEGDDRVEGGAGDDYARGNQGRDVVLGEAGDDRLAGSSGSDQLNGGDGSDRLSGGSDGDALDAGAGNDRVYAGAGNDSGLGGDGDDLMSGGGGRDRLSGDAGDDRLVVRSGLGRLFGGTGDDRLRGGPGRDFLIGEAGVDRLFGYAGNDLIVGGDGPDLAAGNEGDDRIAGRDGADTLRGGDGNDRISGGADRDRIVGGGGRDRIDAGGGDDIVHAAGAGRDVVICGRGTDRVFADRGDRIARSCETVSFR